mmetsp:Transcript_25066/g.24812  ORF Transcript_25066/g.24812 Transcript_25066/m.24812 type:complete len:99 (+) Transcript_25066:3-299(+)
MNKVLELYKRGDYNTKFKLKTLKQTKKRRSRQKVRNDIEKSDKRKERKIVNSCDIFYSTGSTSNLNNIPASTKPETSGKQLRPKNINLRMEKELAKYK